MTNLQENNLKEQEIKKINVYRHGILSLLELYLVLDDKTKFDVELDVEFSRRHAFPVNLKFPFHFPTEREKIVKEMKTIMDSLEILTAKLTVKPIKDFVIEFTPENTTIPVTIFNLMLKTLFEKVVTNLSFFGDAQHNITIATIAFREKKGKEYTLSFSSNFPNNSLVIFDEHLNENEFKNPKQFEILKKCNLLQNYENIERIAITLTSLNDVKGFIIEIY